jgi:hypothetical protein
MVRSRFSSSISPSAPSGDSQRLSVEKFKDRLKSTASTFSIALGFCIAFASGMYAANSPLFNFNHDPPNLRGRISTPRRFDTVPSFREFLSVEKGIDSSNLVLTQVSIPPNEVSIVQRSLANLAATDRRYSNIFSTLASLTSDVPVSVYISDVSTIRTICDWGHAAGCQFGRTNTYRTARTIITTTIQIVFFMRQLYHTNYETVIR